MTATSHGNAIHTTGGESSGGFPIEMAVAPRPADIRVATEFALMVKNQNHCTTFLHAFFERATW